MTDTTNRSNKPLFTAYTITERTGAKNIWTAIGAAWLHTDRKGIAIKLHALPLDGKIVLRIPQEQSGEEVSTTTDEDIPF